MKKTNSGFAVKTHFQDKDKVVPRNLQSFAGSVKHSVDSS